MTHRLFSEQIHLGGENRSQELAEYLAKEWRELGFDEVEMPKYKVLLSYPMEDKPNVISIVNGNGTIVRNLTEQFKVRHILFTGREVRIGKNCTRGLKYGPRPQAVGCTRDRGHSFSQYGATKAGE